MMSRSDILCATIFLSCLFSVGVDGRYCFKCLALDCSGEDLECQNIRAFIQSEIRGLYYFGNYLDPCPPLNETYNWRLMQISDSPCPEEKAGEATCTLGRMQIRTTKVSPEGKPTVVVNHATVMGCANRQLLRRIANAYEERGQCDLDRRKQTSVGQSRELLIEHCRDLSTQCFEKDYCIDFKKSVVKTWGDQSGKKFESTLFFGIMAVVLVVIFALLIAGTFREPPSRPSNLPRSIGDECETVKVLEVREKGLSSIEEPQGNGFAKIGNGTGTLGRSRPAAPPPPPPRLSRSARGGTPV